MSRELNAKQELFCLEYLKDLNATQAAIRSGYSENTAQQTGSENLSKPLISNRVAELMKDRTERVLVDADWVLKRSVELHDRCTQASAVIDCDGEPVLDKEGRPIYRFEHTGVSKALELIGKHVNVQAFSERVEAEVKISHEQWLDALK